MNTTTEQSAYIKNIIHIALQIGHSELKKLNAYAQYLLRTKPTEK